MNNLTILTLFCSSHLDSVTNYIIETDLDNEGLRDEINIIRGEFDDENFEDWAYDDVIGRLSKKRIIKHHKSNKMWMNL